MMRKFLLLVFMLLSSNVFGKDVHVYKNNKHFLKLNDFIKKDNTYRLDLNILSMNHKSALVIPEELHDQKVLISIKKYYGKGDNLIIQSFSKDFTHDITTHLGHTLATHPRAKNGKEGDRGTDDNGQRTRSTHGGKGHPGENGLSSSKLTLNIDIRAIDHLAIIMRSQGGGDGGKGGRGGKGRNATCSDDPHNGKNGGKGGSPGFPGRVNDITVNWTSKYRIPTDSNNIPYGLSVIQAPGVVGIPGPGGDPGQGGNGKSCFLGIGSSDRANWGGYGRHGDFITKDKMPFFGTVGKITINNVAGEEK